MLHINTQNPSPSHSNPLFAFKPRQLLLAEHNRRIKMPTSVLEEENSSKITSLTPDLKENLHQSIIHYLHRNGFSKTLKRFQPEAQIQNDTWKDSSIHLEDIYCKYINDCNSGTNPKTTKKSELGNNGTVQKDGQNVCDLNEEATKKKKKKKDAVETESGAIEDQSKATDNKLAESGKNSGQTLEDIVVNESETKPKKKKKTKHDLDSPSQTEAAKLNVLNKPVVDTVNGLEVDDSTKKPKNKKKKSSQQEKEEDKLESCTTKTESVTHKEEKKKKKKNLSTDFVVEEDQAHPVSTETENGVEADVTKKDKKSSKKRKRFPSDDNDQQSTEVETIEESKRQKTDASKEAKSEAKEINAQKTSNTQLDGLENGKFEINGEKSGSQKPMRKQRNGAEPKTVNAFQRVKIDQVEFAHEKLQDNSYWAKDGSEVGYGAKAQEVLGQVRGKDFRHEKTKKKRGSYRGGMIDLQSHSIKFNYSDEE